MRFALLVIVSLSPLNASVPRKLHRRLNVVQPNATMKNTLYFLDIWRFHDARGDALDVEQSS